MNKIKELYDKGKDFLHSILLYIGDFIIDIFEKAMVFDNKMQNYDEEEELPYEEDTNENDRGKSLIDNKRDLKDKIDDESRKY